MNNNKKLSKFGFALSGLGLMVLVYGFFKMYSLAGNCPNGSAGCTSYSNWHFANEIGLAILVLGILLVITGAIRNKKSR